MVMDRGRVIADDTAARLKATLAGDVIRLGFADAADAERAIAVVQALTDREVTRVGDATIGMTVPEGESLLPAAIRRLDAAGIAVQTATGVPPTLDDVFLALTGRTLREAGEGLAEPEADAPAASDIDTTTDKAGASR